MRTGTLSEYEADFAAMKVLPGWDSRAAHSAALIARNKGRYLAVERVSGVSWVVVALINHMESGGGFSTHLANGQPLNQKTTLEPKGLGPFRTWEEGAVAALLHDKMREAGFVDGKPGWTIGEIGRALESYNGKGYENRGLRSPYLWSGSNHGFGVGKFKENVNGSRFDPQAVSEQVGAMLILKAVMDLGEWTPDLTVQPASPLPLLRFAPIRAYDLNAERLQRWVNLMLSANPDLQIQPLAVDGWAHRKTSDAFRSIGGNYLEGDPRV